MKIDLSNTESSNLSSEDLGALPEGRYNFLIDDARFFKAKTGTPMLEIRLSVYDGKFKNRKAWRRFPLVEKAFGFINELLEAIGSDLAGSSFEIEDLINEVRNAKVSAYLTIEEYKGKKSNRPEKFTEMKQTTRRQPLQSATDEQPAGGDMFS
jgi:hypothetical protein